jgi:polysaccharide export outer membrane protein
MNNSAAAASSAPDDGQATFRLGFEDQIEISVWQDDTLTRTVIIRPDGRISFPLIGDIQAAGYTVSEFQQEVENKIREYIPKAAVTVSVTTITSPKVFVVGEIATPGAYIMGRPLRVMQVLALAGGLLEFADRDGILIIRDKNGQQESMAFDYGKVVKGVDIDQNILLKPGDTIVVP